MDKNKDANGGLQSPSEEAHLLLALKVEDVEGLSATEKDLIQVLGIIFGFGGVYIRHNLSNAKKTSTQKSLEIRIDIVTTLFVQMHHFVDDILHLVINRRFYSLPSLARNMHELNLHIKYLSLTDPKNSVLYLIKNYQDMIKYDGYRTDGKPKTKKHLETPATVLLKETPINIKDSEQLINTLRTQNEIAESDSYPSSIEQLSRECDKLLLIDLDHKNYNSVYRFWSQLTHQHFFSVKDWQSDSESSSVLTLTLGSMSYLNSLSVIALNILHDDKFVDALSVYEKRLGQVATRAEKEFSSRNRKM